MKTQKKCCKDCQKEKSRKSESCKARVLAERLQQNKEQILLEAL